jgi:hypothetical protein
MFQQGFHSRNTLLGRTDVPALAAVDAARTGQTIIGAENDTATTEYVHRKMIIAGFIRGRRGASPALQHGPSDGTVAHIEGEI